MMETTSMRRTMAAEVHEKVGEKVIVRGWCHKIRNLGSVAFVVLRDRSGICQAISEGEGKLQFENESCIEICGTVRSEERAPGGVEIAADWGRSISPAIEEPPIQVNAKNPAFNLETALSHRPISLRHRQAGSVFHVESAIVGAFRDFLSKRGFLEAFTPKIVGSGTEGGSELFRVQYFDRTAYLAQSPQFYKQMLVGAGFERVFETGHAYRAEEHNTSRHLNEYVSLDVEMGFIDSYLDLMDLEEELLTCVFEQVAGHCRPQLEILGVELPLRRTPFARITLKDAASLLQTEYGKTSPPGNLDPEGERLLCRHMRERQGSDFVFVTEYPRSKRPMYAMPCKGDPELTDSFDLLYKGLEITTGGQRIHAYRELVESIRSRGLDPESFSSYLEVFKYGMPPHGGFAIGLERLTAQMLDLGNVREASLFPRDRDRLTP